MAQSPAHRFGQIMGEVLEEAIIPLLQKFAREHHLYLDRHGTRPCRRGKNCSWLDLNGNSHDLDFVLERGGSVDKIGTPAAFIETAWRRYTKHSRNKVQEIQGAIEPLAETYRHSGPFKGAILAGVFTSGALTQLGSLGFTVLYFPYESVVAVFREFGIEAGFTQETADVEFQRKVDAYEALSKPRRKQLATRLLSAHRAAVKKFVSSLEVSISRQIERIVILPLHGESHEVESIDDAIQFIEGYLTKGRAVSVCRYEIEVRYNNGDSIHGRFQDKASAVDFLKTYQPMNPKVL